MSMDGPRILSLLESTEQLDSGVRLPVTGLATSLTLIGVEAIEAALEPS
jgi:hypothetical protein